MAFLNGWAGTITCDDYEGYDALFREGCLIRFVII